MRLLIQGNQRRNYLIAALGLLCFAVLPLAHPCLLRFQRIRAHWQLIVFCALGLVCENRHQIRICVEGLLELSFILLLIKLPWSGDILTITAQAWNIHQRSHVNCLIQLLLSFISSRTFVHFGLWRVYLLLLTTVVAGRTCVKLALGFGDWVDWVH